jgi:replication-associated recombination protein RarA
LERAGNCLIFGPSGVGKTHLAAALTRKMVELGKRAKFFAAHALVQELQHAKLQLQLPAYLRKLDRYDLLVLDDLGYVKKSEAETILNLPNSSIFCASVATDRYLSFRSEHSFRDTYPTITCRDMSNHLTFNTAL